jgi:guanylate kinase
VSPRVVILSAPSGGGKTTIARRLAQRRGDVGISVSATTRGPRPGERHGEAYHFVSRPEFQRRIEAGEFLEWAQYAGELYGTLRSDVEQLRRGGRHALLDIEVQGARQVRAHLPAGDVIAVFVLPPDAPTWVKRLRGRRSDTGAALARRFAVAEGEIAAAGEYDHIVVNDDLERAVSEVAAIIDSGGSPARRPADWERRTSELRAAALAAGGALEERS